MKHEQQITQEELHQYLLQSVHQLEWVLSSTKAIGQQFYNKNPVWNKRMMTEKEVLSDLDNNTIFVTANSYLHDFFGSNGDDNTMIIEMLLWFSELCDSCQRIDFKN